MEHTTVAGTELAFEVTGPESDDTVALAFVHGWLSCLDHWDAQAEYFATGGHRVVRWDRRGMGRSANGPVAATPQQHADDLAAILDHVGVDRVVVFGHAGGGPSAVTFAATYPDRADGLVLVDSHVHSPPAEPESDPLVARVEGMATGLAGEDAAGFLAPVYASFFGPLAPPTVVEAAIANAQKVDPAIAISELRHVVGDLVSIAAAVRCPVLSISVDPTDTASVRSTFGAAERVDVGHVVGAGHFLHLEVPDQFNAMANTFLGRL